MSSIVTDKKDYPIYNGKLFRYLAEEEWGKDSTK